MNVKDAAARQYRVIVDRAAQSIGRQPLPANEGWIATARKALGMSAAQLARRLGVTRARISQAEQAELSGSVTLKTMQATAKAMDAASSMRSCRLKATSRTSSRHKPAGRLARWLAKPATIWRWSANRCRMRKTGQRPRE